MTDAERCICCGEIIPEGRQVCIKCEINQTKDFGDSKMDKKIFWAKKFNEARRAIGMEELPLSEIMPLISLIMRKASEINGNKLLSVTIEDISIAIELASTDEICRAKSKRPVSVPNITRKVAKILAELQKESEF